ncbi:PAS domain-containing protein [Halopseudomonas pachastrellae]|nr:PAS domain-containing protein [Halopseudomonas pachastrellae]
MAATVFENTTGAIVVTDPAGYIAQVNENFSRITGYSPEQVIDQLPALLVGQQHEPAFYAEILSTLRSEGRWEGELWQQRRNGEGFPTWRVFPRYMTTTVTWSAMSAFCRYQRTQGNRGAH